MKNVRARIIEFNDEGQPLDVPDDGWRVRRDGSDVIFSHRGFTTRRDLASGVDYLILKDHDEHVALGTTAGRLALTAASSRLLLGRRGTGIGGALADLRVAGTAKRTVCHAHLIFTDTSVVDFSCADHEFAVLLKMVPAQATDESGYEAALTKADFVTRLREDGQRGVDEMIAKRSELIADRDAQLDIAKNHHTFAGRDGARQRAREIDRDIEKLDVLARAARYWIGIDAGIGTRPTALDTPLHSFASNRLLIGVVAVMLIALLVGRVFRSEPRGLPAGALDAVQQEPTQASATVPPSRPQPRRSDRPDAAGRYVAPHAEAVAEASTPEPASRREFTPTGDLRISDSQYASTYSVISSDDRIANGLRMFYTGVVDEGGTHVCRGVEVEAPNGAVRSGWECHSTNPNNPGP